MKKKLYLFSVLLLGLVACKSDVPVTGVALNHNAITLYVGETQALVATVSPLDATNRDVTWSSNNTAVATVSPQGIITAVSAGTATITVTTEDGGRTATCVVTVMNDYVANPDGVVINNIRWATRNVDAPGTFARNPEDAGRFYQWGVLFNGGMIHHWPNSGAVTGWNPSNERTSWTTTNDPCPAGWRVPTREELQYLVDAGSIWTQRNGVNGRLFGTAPYQIFLPAAGLRSNMDGLLSHVGSHTSYWSNTLRGLGEAYRFQIHSDGASVRQAFRALGCFIRCVAE